MSIPSTSRLRESHASASTKRQVQLTISAAYDPLGLVAPVVLNGCLLLPQLWKEGQSWDEPLPTGFEEHWSQLVSAMADIFTLCVPRCCGQSSHDFKVELHVFTSASVHAYAAANVLITDLEVTPLVCSPTWSTVRLIYPPQLLPTANVTRTKASSYPD